MGSDAQMKSTVKSKYNCSSKARCVSISMMIYKHSKLGQT